MTGAPDLVGALYAAAAGAGLDPVEVNTGRGRCALRCRRCGWRTPSDVVVAKFVASPHGCVACDVEAGRAITPGSVGKVDREALRAALFGGAAEARA